jgi:hypothetical protein
VADRPAFGRFCQSECRLFPAKWWGKAGPVSEMTAVGRGRQSRGDFSWRVPRSCR